MVFWDIETGVGEIRSSFLETRTRCQVPQCRSSGQLNLSQLVQLPRPLVNTGDASRKMRLGIGGRTLENTTSQLPCVCDWGCWLMADESRIAEPDHASVTASRKKLRRAGAGRLALTVGAFVFFDYLEQLVDICFVVFEPTC